jgi:hypothetical protein
MASPANAVGATPEAEPGPPSSGSLGAQTTQSSGSGSGADTKQYIEEADGDGKEGKGGSDEDYSDSLDSNERGGGDEDEDTDEDEDEDEDEDDEDLEEGVMDTLRKIVKDKQMQKVKFANGKTMRVDLTTASAMVNAHDKRIKNDKTKAKFADAVEKDPNSFMKMMDIALGDK